MNPFEKTSNDNKTERVTFDDIIRRQPEPTLPRQEDEPTLSPIENKETLPKVKSKKFAPRQKMSKIFKSGGKKTKKILIIVGAAIIVVLVGLFVISDLTLPVHIGKVETLLAMSSRTVDAPAQSDFKAGEPIMLHFEFSGAGVGLTIKFDVKNQQGEKVKSGVTTVLRPTNGDPADGQRYVSIVNTPSTSLPVGRYTVDLSSGDRVVKTYVFNVVE